MGTDFSCDGKVFGGYYADLEMGCQVYNVCLSEPTSCLCPNGTLFQQQTLNCDWWYNVDCAAAKGLYGLATEGAFGSDAAGTGGDSGECHQGFLARNNNTQFGTWW